MRKVKTFGLTSTKFSAAWYILSHVPICILFLQLAVHIVGNDGRLNIEKGHLRLTRSSYDGLFLCA